MPELLNENASTPLRPSIFKVINNKYKKICLEFLIDCINILKSNSFFS